MPSLGAANPKNTRTSVSGVFRTVLTYSVPKVRIAGTGDTRSAPSSVPSSSAPMPPMTNSLMLNQKNCANRPALSVSTEKNSPIAGPPRGSVPLELRRLRRRPGLAQRAVVDLLPGAVGERLFQHVVDGVPQRLVVVRQADAVLLGAERLADDLQGGGVLRREALEDRVVRRDGVHLLVLQLRHALRVGLELDDVRGLGEVLVAHPLDRRGAGGRAHLLALERVLAGDRGLVLADQQVLPGDEVRAGEADVVLALVGDRVGADVVVDLPTLDRRLAVGRRDLGVLDLRRVDAEAGGHQLRDLDVEAAPLAARVLVAEVRLVRLDADLDRAGALDLVERRAAGDRRRGRRELHAGRRAGVRRGAAGAAGARRAGLATAGQGDRQGGTSQDDGAGAQLHGSSFLETSCVRRRGGGRRPGRSGLVSGSGSWTGSPSPAPTGGG